MTEILRLENVSKAFGGIRAVNDVSFTLQEGEIVGLIGPNGAGKTTLVNLITGVHPLTSGKVIFAGADVSRQKPFQAARRGLARTFQIVQPFPDMSVLENVAAGSLFGGGHAAMGAAMRAARDELDFVGLGPVAHQPAALLSLPNRKRLELAKSLAMKPKVLLLDEVNAGLNAAEIDGALDLILARQPVHAAHDALPFQVFDGIRLWPVEEYLEQHPRPDLPRLAERLHGLGAGPHGHNAGDIVLIAKSGLERPITDRFYFSSLYRSWHGSPTEQDSRIPLIVGRAGGSADEIRARVQAAVGERATQLDVTRLILALLERD